MASSAARARAPTMSTSMFTPAARWTGAAPAAGPSARSSRGRGHRPPQGPPRRRARVAIEVLHEPPVDEHVRNAGRVLARVLVGGRVLDALAVEADEVGGRPLPDHAAVPEAEPPARQQG